jgi:hypothetical protein
MSNVMGVCACMISAAVLIFAPSVAISQAGCEYRSYALPDSVVPPLQGEGYATLWTFDGRGNCKDPDSLTFRIAYSGLNSDPIGVGIHRGAAGENGDEVIPILDGQFVSGIEVTVYLPEDTCWDIKSGTGGYYFILETTDHPAGAVRGQVWVECWSPTVHSTWGRVRSAYR